MMADEKKRILDAIREDWTAPVDALMKRTRVKNLSIEEMEKIRLDVQVLLTSIKYWVQTRNQTEETYPEWATMMEGITDVISEFKKSMDLKIDHMKKTAQSNIDSNLRMIQSTIYNSAGISLSGLTVMKSSLIEYKMMLADGRAHSSLPDPKGLIEGLQDKISELIERAERAHEFEVITDLYQSEKSESIEQRIVNSGMHACTKALAFIFLGIKLNQTKSNTLTGNKKLYTDQYKKLREPALSEGPSTEIAPQRWGYFNDDKEKLFSLLNGNSRAIELAEKFYEKQQY